MAFVGKVETKKRKKKKKKKERKIGNGWAKGERKMRNRAFVVERTKGKQVNLQTANDYDWLTEVK
jgi:hypothetical protein